MVSILIFVAVLNLFLFYQDTSSDSNQSISILKIADVKVNSEVIATSAISVANGNMEDKEILEQKIQSVENTIKAIKSGGVVDGQTIEKIPYSLNSEYEKITISWKNFKDSTRQIEKITVFDQEALSAINYILRKNNDLVLTANELNKEIEGLDRDYSRHKEIVKDLLECSKIIGQQTLLISIGEGTNTQEELKNKRLQFDIGLRKLLQISTLDLDVQSVGAEHEELIPLPREKSNSLRELDPLWESMQPKIMILEERVLLSPEFNIAKNEMIENKEVFYSDIDSVLQKWSTQIVEHKSDDLIVVQTILAVDIGIFFIVLFMIRKSLNPFEAIIQAISKIKEGMYGETIQYSGKDEVGQLVENFNIMSKTIKEKEEEAKKTDIAKDEFLAMITHELKTPLVPIQGYSDILLSEHLGKLTSKQKERIRIIKSSSETLLSMISDLLDAQKLELGQLKMTKTISGIRDTVDKAIKPFKIEAESKNIKIFSEGENIQIVHDSDRISQVIANLIRNSINAIQSDKGEIKISIEDNPKEVIVHVKDDGIGIPQDKQNDLFKKFYQVDATLTRERGGSGLGLAICKGIIDYHSGKIWVSSTPNQGATFSFSLPKEIPDKNKTPL
ncbi:HAMP domain-containing sensor histidine kinase [Candidatus Nitrosopumilus sediminis]|uniref:histidine kinase n=1 Tax=Candidatus Nitrosopumilus sediminis TaxID=1229909 RepID=K0B9Z3_9ARCH|nr:HAMP domain-containing sensor histidine kinase [Candidatus Nitrosopumilus sediminis]AFS83038.1 integral membrane sensor signal transduction histidine kinase [Candidatus Nitrosopumilus sediminis]